MARGSIPLTARPALRRFDARARRGLLPIGALVFAAFAACQRPEPRERANSSPAGTATESPRQARSAHFQLSVSNVEDCRNVADDAPADSTRRIGVELALEPVGDLQVPANPYYARLVDEHQQVFEATLGGCGVPLSPSLPRRGQVARGHIVFDVPRSSRRLTLLYMPELIGAPSEEVSIALGP